MNTDVVPYLRCPVCGDRLAAAGGPAPTSLRCPRGHSFDVARQGYVALTAGPLRHTGDTPPMVAAREEFFAAGHYDFISAALADAALADAALADAAPADAGRPVGDAGGPGGPGGPAGPPRGRLIVDAGAGTGRHLAAVLDALPDAVGLALDVSKPALRRAARAHPRAGAALCDTWRPLPLADRAAALVLDVFAPRNGAEFRRVLRPDGALLVVTPEPDHLAELVTALDLLRVDPEKPARVAATLGPGFAAVGESVHRRRLRLPRRHVQALVDMGPSAWHAAPDRLRRRLSALPEEVTVTASVRLRRYRTPAAAKRA